MSKALDLDNDLVPKALRMMDDLMDSADERVVHNAAQDILDRSKAYRKKSDGAQIAAFVMDKDAFDGVLGVIGNMFGIKNSPVPILPERVVSEPAESPEIEYIEEG